MIDQTIVLGANLFQSLVFGLIAGLASGAVFAILGAGLVVAFRGSGVINFAHGAVAAYTAYTFHQLRADDGGDIRMPWVDPIPEWGLLQDLKLSNLPVRFHIMDDPPTWLAIVLSLLMAAVIGLMLHFLVFRPLRNAPTLGKVIGSVGAFLYLQSVALLNFGPQLRSETGFWEFTSDAEKKPPLENFLGLDANLPRSTMALAITAVIIGAAVWAFFRYSRFGLATRAADENEKGATLLGYNPQRLAMANWVLSSVLAGIAGIVFLHRTQPNLFLLFVIPALGAALMGNLTSIPGAVGGGLAIGAVASAGVALTAESWWPVSALPAEGVRNVIPLLAIILVLYLRGDKLPIRGSISIGRQPRAPKTNNAVLGVAAAVGIALMLSNIFTSAWESALTTSLVFTLFMFSLVVLVGYLGQVSLAQWSLAGVAAWTVARLMADGDKIREFEFFVKNGPNWPLFLAIIGGVAASVVVGLIVGLPALRIRGVQLAVVTLAAVIAIEDLLLRNLWLFGDGSDSTNPMPIASIGDTNLSGFNEKTNQTDNWRYTVFLLIIVAIVGLIVVNLRRGAIGRRFLAVRANERAAAAAGINVANTKMLGFAISSGIAGLAGVMFAFKLSSLTSENFSPFVGLALLAFVYLGGITTAYGAIAGGLLVAGGISAEIGALHFDGVTQAIINLVGAIGLVVNAIVTNGEGIALLQTDQGKHILAGLRRDPTLAPEDTILTISQEELAEGAVVEGAEA
ncbi:MAG: ABC transporter permease [Actinomycetota bacterium]